MKIAILGYGKMGQAIEQVALERKHEIVLKTDRKQPASTANFASATVAIDFSTPDTAFGNINAALNKGIPVISGTTAWLEQLEEAQKIALQNDTAFLYSSNFSIGVNLFFELNKKLAELMKEQVQYTPSIKEIHHIHKVDAPSGTAITLSEELSKKVIIDSERTGAVPGTHIVTYQSQVDTITIKHEAHSRKGFALGAVLAAEWIENKKGIFSMSDMLNL